VAKAHPADVDVEALRQRVEIAAAHPELLLPPLKPLQFVDDRPWVHVDIAGTAWGGTRPYVGGGANGFGVRMLVELAQRAVDKATH